MARRRQVPILRLAGVLDRYMREKELNWTTLSDAVSRANGCQGEEEAVRRRKLTEIVRGDATSFTMKDLVALDCFLATLGESLADKPLFEMPTSLRALVKSEHLIFVLGSHPRATGGEPHTDVAWWDVRAMGHVLRGAERIKPGLEVTIECVPGQDVGRPPSFLQDESATSICCIGSPRACRGTELLLREMLRDSEGRRGSATYLKFIHSGTTPPKFASAFEAQPEEIQSLDKEVVRGLKNGSVPSALVLKDRVYPSIKGKERPTESVTHGVVVTQRRSERSVWMVLAGLTGPATFGCAAAVINEETSALTDGGESSVRYDVVETIVKDPQDSSPLDCREVVAARVV